MLKKCMKYMKQRKGLCMRTQLSKSSFYIPFISYSHPTMVLLPNYPEPKCAPVIETVSPVYFMHLTFSQMTSESLNDGQPCSIDSLYQSLYLRIVFQ